MRAVKIRASLVRCGTCGKAKRLGERHVCRTRLDKPERRGKTKVQLKVRPTYGKCGTCKKEITSWPHTCAVSTDFKKRKAERAKREVAERRKAAAAKRRRQRNEHPPASECEDEDCPRYPCVQARIAYRKGHAAGYASGFAQGHAEGYAEGYAAGYAAGSGGS